ncbi:hypothetical protein MJD09_09465 [bacterium]|nr:hypothetical protein [bacterium]
MNLSADIRDFYPSLRGWIIIIGCPKCGQTFEALQPTIAGVALGEHICSECQTKIEVCPNDLVAAFLRYVPKLTPEEEAKTLATDADQVASAWYRTDFLSGILYYKGINLGEACEKALLRHIMFGLYIDSVENSI